jgi:hypothetical protein
MGSIVNAWIADMKDDRKETVSCHVMMEACLDSKELNLEDMEFEVEHWEVPTYETTVKSLGRMKKRHGLASSFRETWRAKGTVTCRKVSCHARVTVEWHKRNIVRNKWTRAKDE